MNASTNAKPTHIVKKVHPRDGALEMDARERKLAGQYRVIHGTVTVALPKDKWADAEGRAIPGMPTTETAIEGDVVYLSDEDAARMLDADIVEPLTTNPSREGKVWAPPATARNKYIVGSGDIVGGPDRVAGPARRAGGKKGN